MFKGFNRHEILYNHYKKDIEETWDFDFIQKELDFAEPEQIDDNDGNPYALVYIGTIMNIFPSGKVWALWTTNQSRSDMYRDTQFSEALNDILDQYGMWYEIGSNGDGCDVFIGKCID